MATLIVRRDRGYADKWRKYRILLDGVEIGKLAQGEELRQEISEGLHEIQARIDWSGSRHMAFDARSGEQVVLVRSSLRGWRIVLAPLFILFNWGDYLKLERQGRDAG